MKKRTLSNGLKVIYKKKPGSVAVLQVMIKVGSNHEKKEERGIAHFLEHILFEGTTSRPTNQLISNEIEKIGGDFNAYTTGDRTCFYIKVLKKHFGKAVDVLADILQNPLFKKEHIEKEKNIVLKEIGMVHDEPSYYQWTFLQQNLFTKHPVRFPTYGDENVIKGLTPKKVREFFDAWYVPNNMVVSIVGDIKGWEKKIKGKFVARQKETPRIKIEKEPEQKRNKVITEHRKTVNTYSILAFKTIPRDHPDSYVLELINGILGRGQSGKMFIEIRSKRGLAYEVGTQNIGELNHGFFAIYATIDKKNVRLVRKLILDEVSKLAYITEKELQEAKTFVEGSYLIDMEDSQKVADQVVFWEHIEKAELMDSLLKKVKEITVQDVQRVTKKYFTKYTQVIVAGK